MCGIVGVKGVRKAVEIAVVGAHVIQNRARTFAGGVSCDGQHFYPHAGKGLARSVFTSRALNGMHGKDALVHIRYPTVGDKADRDNTQPICGIYNGKPIAIAHNGNLTNIDALRQLLPQDAEMATSLDTEYILRLLELWQTGDLEKDLAAVFSHLRGSFNLVILVPEKMIAVRDPSGNRPLSVGKLNGGYCIASEDCAFPNMGAEFLQDVAAGTMAVVDADGLREVRFAQPRLKKCVFELLYNSSQASTIFGVPVSAFRKRVGAELSRLFPLVDGPDLIVTPIPDSANSYAVGYARDLASGEWNQVIFRNHYVGRTFNAATQALRDEEVSRKFIFDADTIRGKRIVVLDDSVVRGTTLPKIVEMLWRLGAAEVHVRIGSPKIVNICIYGIYMDEDETDLIAAKLSTEEIRAKVGATSLGFLPLEVLKSLLVDPENYCFTCMGEDYW